MPAGTGASQVVRNNCYGLLYQLLEQEKDVSLLRFIKREDSDVKILVKEIAAASRAGSIKLAEFARQDPSIQLHEIGLPPGEVAARKSIAATKKQDLLGHSGGEFELSLLLSQAEALNYAWHLAEVGAQNDSQSDRASIISGISQEMESLYRRVFVLLLSKSNLSANQPSPR